MSIRSLRLNGLLSFSPRSAPFDLQALNVLIGPNASGKSNLIEAIDLLSAAPRDLAAVIRDGGGPHEWLWKGSDRDEPAEIETVLDGAPTGRPLRHRIKMTAVESRVEVIDEAIEELQPSPGQPPEADVYFYYRFQQGHPVINIYDGTQPLPAQSHTPTPSPCTPTHTPSPHTVRHPPCSVILNLFLLVEATACSIS